MKRNPPRNQVTARLEILGVPGIPEVHPGDDLVRLLLAALGRQSIALQNGDIIVVTQKVLSKAEGQLVKLDEVSPSAFAETIAKATRKDPRLVEVILSESKRIVKMARGVVIVETKHGFVCANAGVDQSNVDVGYVALLPKDPDLSARRFRLKVKKALNVDVAVIISDTFGRPWREGQTDVAIGVSGLEPIRDYRGIRDAYGYELKVTEIAVADELAAAAELIIGKLERVPIAIIRGCQFPAVEGTARKLIRRPSKDLFR